MINIDKKSQTNEFTLSLLMSDELFMKTLEQNTKDNFIGPKRMSICLHFLMLGIEMKMKSTRLQNAKTCPNITPSHR
ncbi:hypothetical protein M2145_001354 [Lachnospiraceae bacterium PF1-21]|uniref:hypothetical protein n=1 Tax=Ohessyouella blattaphilus TaxID=2949333 RepID=UPI003E31C4CA